MHEMTGWSPTGRVGHGTGRRRHAAGRRGFPAGAVAWLGAVALLAASAGVVTGGVAVASGAPGDPGFILVWDLGGASGELDAVLLNPAAASGLRETFLSVRAASAPEGGGRWPAYTLALMDSGGPLAGGLVGYIEAPPGGDRDWRVSYTVAGAAGSVAAGARVTWKLVRLEGGGARNLWYVDAGLVRRLGPLLQVGMAAYGLKFHESWPGQNPGARLGLMAVGPGSRGWLVGVGVADEDLSAPGGWSAEAGAAVPLGRAGRAAVTFRRPLGGQGSGQVGAGLWSAGLAGRVGALAFEVGYRSDRVYLIGIRAAR